jgi:hypothetical protein
MMKNPQDNYAATRALIAQRIIASSINPSIGYPGAKVNHDRDRLEQVARGEGDSTGFSFLNVEFRKADSGCSLYVRCDDVSYEPRTDAEGNEWRQYQVTTEASWPSHGGTSPGTSLARLAFYTQVALLAAEIEAEFGGRAEVWRMTRTAAQVAEANAKAEQERIERRLVDACHNGTGKGLRKGKLQCMTVDEMKDLPDMEDRLVEVFGKSYTVAIKTDTSGSGIRVGMISRVS